MKRLITLSLVALLSMPAMASVEAEKHCRGIGLFASIVMKSRQAGMTINEQLDVLDKRERPEELRNMYYELILDAYKVPYYHTQEMKDTAISEFENKHFLACVDIARTM